MMRLHQTSSAKRVLYALSVLSTVLVFGLPLVWMLLASLMTRGEVTSRPPTYFPAEPQWGNFLSFLDEGSIIGQQTTVIAYGLRNSLAIATIVTFLNLVFGSLAAYPLARSRQSGASALMFVYIATRMLPTITLVVPLFVIFRSFGLLDTLTGLILANLPYTLPFTIWILAAYFRLIPADIEAAGLVDGCGPFGVLRHLVLPLSKPALVSAGIFSFVLVWSEFILAVILTGTTAAMPITAAAGQFSNNIYTNYNLLAAAGIVALVPPLLLSLLFQRHIISGLTAGISR